MANIRGWFADLCDTLPADYEIDYVRVYQQPGTEKVGCSPASHPTSQWIHSHWEDYVVGEMAQPLKGVRPGGASCSTDDECNAPRGACRVGLCVCLEEVWTGPRCLSQASCTCHVLPRAM